MGSENETSVEPHKGMSSFMVSARLSIDEHQRCCLLGLGVDCRRCSLATWLTTRCCAACRWWHSQGSTSSWWDALAPGRAASYTCWADSTSRGAGPSGELAPTPHG